jgi:hypothetical protein
MEFAIEMIIKATLFDLKIRPAASSAITATGQGFLDFLKAAAPDQAARASLR